MNYLLLRQGFGPQGEEAYKTLTYTFAKTEKPMPEGIQHNCTVEVSQNIRLLASPKEVAFALRKLAWLILEGEQIK